MKSIAIAIAAILIGASFVPAGDFGKKTVFNPFTGKFDYMLDGAAIFDQISNSRASIPIPCGDDPTTAIFDGAPGATGATGRSSLFCNISAAVRSFNYDSLGVNPQPPLQAFAVQLWHGAVRLIADAYVWWTGGPENRVYGSSTSATFTPSVKPSFSNLSGNNYVAVQVSYSSASTGRQYCTTGIPIAVTRSGIQGEPGIDGSADTQADILGKIDDPTTGAILTMQMGNGEASTAAKIRVKSFSGNTVWFIDEGNAYHKDANGINRITLAIDGSITTRDAANKIRLVTETSGQVTRYEQDGTTIAFRAYSTGGYGVYRSGVLRQQVDKYGQVFGYRGDGVTLSFANRSTSLTL